MQFQPAGLQISNTGLELRSPQTADHSSVHNALRFQGSHAFIFSRNSELYGQGYELLNTATSVFLLLHKAHLCLCFHLLCHLRICHPHIVICTSNQLIQLPHCTQVSHLLLHCLQQFICSPGLLTPSHIPLQQFSASAPT